MNKKIIFFSLSYFLAGVCFILLQDHVSFVQELIMKSLIIPILMILYMVSLKPFSGKLNRLIFAGLFFSWAGDVILEFSGLFVPGLICFLIAHVMYLTAFYITPGKNVVFGNRYYLLFPVLLAGFGLVFYLYDGLGAMRIPVIAYSAVILTMLAAAVNRLEKVNARSYWLVLAGAILFVISDSGIAINKFGHPFESSGIVIMSTYILAQYLIVMGYIRQVGDRQA